METNIDHIEEIKAELEDARWQLEIETALEHIRAQAMAMESSEELVETARVTFEQLTSLGLNLILCGWEIYNDESATANAWLTFDQEARDFFTVFATYDQFNSDPLNRAHLQSWHDKEPFFRKVLEGEMLEANQAFLSELRKKDQLSGSLPNLRPDARLFVTFARFNRGYLTAATENELNDRDLKVLRRVTVAFERAFQRFEDLQKAEAAAREAQIEAALERVRGRALAMRTTDQLLSIAELVTDQLVLLGLNMGSAFVSTVDEERDVYGLYTCCSQRHPLEDLRGKSGAWKYSFAAISAPGTIPLKMRILNSG
jgi:hypothetical protein